MYSKEYVFLQNILTKNYSCYLIIWITSDWLDTAQQSIHKIRLLDLESKMIPWPGYSKERLFKKVFPRCGPLTLYQSRHSRKTKTVEIHKIRLLDLESKMIPWPGYS